MPVVINLSKSDSSIPWGFRLHGGKDFGSPLTVQRINPGSLAAKCGLLIGDNLSAIDSVQTSGLKHKEAQDLIVKAGNNIQLTICRGDEIPVRNVDHSIEPLVLKLTTVKVDENNGKAASSSWSQPQILTITRQDSSEKPASNNYLAKTAAPYKPSQHISSNNSSLYQPSMQTITSGLTKNHQQQSGETETHEEDFFPPPPPPLPSSGPPSATSPFSFSKSTKPHQPVQYYPDVTITNDSTSKSNVDNSGSKYVPSETYKLVKDMESGLDVPFNPRTGAGVRSSPIQSKLVDILEKKHATLEGSPGGITATQYMGPKTCTSSYAISNAINNPNNKTRSISPALRNNNTKTSPPGISGAGGGPSKFQPSSPSNFSASSSNQKASEPLDPNKVPICNVCNSPVRGAYILAVNKIWCPDHFLCSHCRKPLSDSGFVEEEGLLYCKEDYEKFLAPRCNKCQKPIVGNTVKALKATFHPECFTCKQCNQPIMGGSFHLHEGEVYCDRDFKAMFSTKCIGCNFPIEMGDNWIEAAGTNWHGECFNCQVCKVNLQNIGFVHKNGQFLCRDHARSV